MFFLGDSWHGVVPLRVSSFSLRMSGSLAGIVVFLADVGFPCGYRRFPCGCWVPLRVSSFSLRMLGSSLRIVGAGSRVSGGASLLGEHFTEYYVILCYFLVSCSCHTEVRRRSFTSQGLQVLNSSVDIRSVGLWGCVLHIVGSNLS